jgi:flagellar hook-length control protein FliK
MNSASIPLAVVGAAGSGLPLASGNAPGGQDGAFADALSLALSGALPQPIVPSLQPVVQGAGDFALTLPDPAAVAAPGGGLDLLLDERALGALAASLLPGAALQTQDSLSGSVTSEGNIAARRRANDAALMTPATINQPSAGSSNVALQAMPGRSPDSAPITPEQASSSPLPSLPSDVNAQQPASERMASGASMMALATTVLPSPDGAIQVEEALAQLRQSLSSRSDRQGVAGGIGDPAPPSIEAAMAQPAARVGQHAEQTGQASRSRADLPAGASTGRHDGSLSNAEQLLEARASAAKLHGLNQQQGIQAAGAAKAAMTGPERDIDPAEAISLEFQSSEGRLDAIGSEVGRAEPAATAGSKSSTPLIQPANTQIAVQIARALPQGIDRFSIQLHPADLGAVEIQLDIAEDGRLSALIIAERPETLDMLQRDSRALERSLNDTGLRLENGGLSFSLKQEHNQQGQGFNAWSHQQQNAYPGGRIEHGVVDGPAEQPPIRQSQQRLLDIRT